MDDSAFFKLKENYRNATAAGQDWNVVRGTARDDIACNNVMVALDRLIDVPQVPDKKAICVLANYRAGSKEGVGTVVFQQKEGEDVRVTVEISGLGPDQQHALTINQFGDLSVGNFHSTGKHFSHVGQKHGPPEAVSRHVGDLGNITADPKGVANGNWSDKVISLYGQNNIIGRSVAVHARKDDFGEGTQDVIRSRESGNAGPILSCGVIGLAFDTNMSTRSEDFQREFLLELTQAYRAAETTKRWNMVVGCASGDDKCGALIKALQQLMELPVHPQQCDSGPRKAVCLLVCPKQKDTKGTITFKQETRDTSVTISGNLSGLSGSTQHGFTIHEFGDLSGAYETVRGHFNPTNQVHGGPEDTVRHIGDLGNIDGGSTNFPSIVNKTNGLISLFDGFNNVIGRALVVHQFRDDLGRGVGDDQSESQRTGNAGGAIALGVIGIAEVGASLANAPKGGLFDAFTANPLFTGGAGLIGKASTQFFFMPGQSHHYMSYGGRLVRVECERTEQMLQRADKRRTPLETVRLTTIVQTWRFFGDN
ncbi:hypothetical protein niasHT_028149 [Heterodera trifolii]|uniref:Superoxide dismutase copper/zinc binding domain-containing protein n=1 Tax=Heterodera trifolii TaxID=157864 RepID=A0ABD2JNR8_9BILA